MAQPIDLRHAPEREALLRLCEQVASGARPARVRLLRGGVDTSMHAIDVVEPSSARRRLVLKRYDPARASRGPAVVCRLMWQTLVALERLDLPAPRPVWWDADGAIFGTPSVVMTWVPGRVEVNPRDPATWATRLADMLASIHRTPLDRVDLSFLPHTEDRLERWFVRLSQEAAVIDAHPDGRTVREALLHLRPRRRPGEPVLTHGDYHPGNVLWRRGRLVAVVDWDGATVGDPGHDVGFCRMALALQHVEGAADHFVRAYEAAAGRQAPNLLFWELLSAALAIRYQHLWLASMHSLGRIDLTPESINARLRGFIAEALAASERA